MNRAAWPLVAGFQRAPWPITIRDDDDLFDLIAASSTAAEREHLLSLSLGIMDGAGHSLLDGAQALERRLLDSIGCRARSAGRRSARECGDAEGRGTGGQH